MNEIEISPGVAMGFRDDDFSDPWRSADVAVLLHGVAESGLLWNAWMPSLGRQLRVIRPDMRGFGRSTPMPLDHSWSLDEIVNDYLRLADRLGIERFHLVGSKIGGSCALRLAAAHPSRVRTLTVLGPRIVGSKSPNGRPETLMRIKEEGVAVWARATMSGRLGTTCPPEMFEGWIALMGQTAPSTLLGLLGGIIPQLDLSADLPKVECPTLVIVNEGSVLSSPEETRRWQELIPQSELLVLEGDSFNVAATNVEASVSATLAFIDRDASKSR